MSVASRFGWLNFQPNCDSPDCGCTITKDALMVCCTLKVPGWVMNAFKKTPTTMGRGSFEGGSHHFGAGRMVPKKLPQLDEVKQLHAYITESGNMVPLSKRNILMNMYVKCGSMVDARHVFDNMPEHDVISWNVMILGYAKQDEGPLALELYAQMHKEDVRPSGRTFVAVLKACSSLIAMEEGKQVDGKVVKIGCLEKGRAIHSEVMSSGFDSDVFVGTTLVDFYAKCGSMEDAHHAFDELPQHDVVSWTAMIFGYAKQKKGALALELYAQMHKEGIQPNAQTFVCVLKACSSQATLEVGKGVEGKLVKAVCLEEGRAIHSQVVESGFEIDVFAATTLVDMYAKCGSMEDARHTFDELAHRDVVSWNAMIFGYAEQEESDKALKLYVQMQEQGLPANSLTFVSILKACGFIAALETGKELHAQIRRVGLETTSIVVTTLIDMYAKCGSMVEAQELFDALPTRDIVAWSALLAGYAHLGQSELAFHVFDRMRQEGIQPDKLTFLNLLTVCNHAGLVDTGQEYFQIMSEQYSVVPTVEHYNCMIDLLGRAGQVDEAVAVAEKMPFEPDVVVWLTLLGACLQGKNVEVGRRVFDHLVKFEENHPGAYVLMSNLYAHVHRCEDLNKIQVMRKNIQAVREPTQIGWTDIGGMVHAFEMGDLRHPQSKDIL